MFWLLSRGNPPGDPRPGSEYRWHMPARKRIIQSVPISSTILATNQPRRGNERVMDSAYRAGYCSAILGMLFFAFAGAPPVLARAPQSPTRYAPPEATFNAGSQLQVLQVEIDQKNLADAAVRLDAL